MKKKIEFNFKNIIILILVICILSSVSSYLSTSYALEENDYPIHSEKVEYNDNFNLGADNVQAAINGTCVKFNNQLTNLKKEVISEMYPKGSIYISTELSTKEAVAEKLGGTWESYGQGRTLIGSDSSSYKVGNTGGSTSVSTTLTTANLPKHTHTISHTHTTSEINTTKMSLTTSEAGEHSHTTYMKRVNLDPAATGNTFVTVHITNTYPDGNIANAGSVVLSSGAHTHSVSGSVTIPSLSTSSQSTTTSGSAGSSTSFTTSTMQPYIVVYMYRRTAFICIEELHSSFSLPFFML